MSERGYRRRLRPRGLVSFLVAVRQSDLWVCAERDLSAETRDLLIAARLQIESYIREHPRFLDTLEAFPQDACAAPLVREMIAGSRPLNVGPMAAVAGAVAEAVGRGLLAFSGQVIVENGGDIFLKVDRGVTVAVHAGASPLSGRFGLRIEPDRTPLGVCSSSGTVGHSLSLGRADAVCVLAASAALADAAATALGNRIGGREDLQPAMDWIRRHDGIRGGLAIVGRHLASWGEIDLVEL